MVLNFKKNPPKIKMDDIALARFTGPKTRPDIRVGFWVEVVIGIILYLLLLGD